MVLSFVRRDKLELAFWLMCSMHFVGLSYRSLQMQWWVAVTVNAIPLQPDLLM